MLLAKHNGFTDKKIAKIKNISEKKLENLGIKIILDQYLDL